MSISASRVILAGLAVMTSAGQVLAQATPEQMAERERQYQEELAMPNPIEASGSVWIEELTWLEVRDRIADGYTTAIVSTGGIEQNGPYLATGKHNVILEALCPAIAEKLGNALCAPIVAFVPEGSIDPPTGAMRYPGTITVRDETYLALLEDIGASLGAHGFTDIIYIGDSGGNQTGMEAAAATLNERWAGSGRTAHFVREFYSPGWEETERYTEEVLGVAEGESDGYHDDMWVTAFMAVVDPETVRWDQRVAAGLASINGVSLVPLQRIIDLGERIVDFRAEYTVRAIRESIARADDGR
ncbi:MAG: creatininase family protein [Gemmatimonadota bacterium]